MTLYHYLAIGWLCLLVASATAHWLLRERWTRTLLAVLLAPLAGVLWAWGLLRRQREPAGLEEPTNPEPPPGWPPKRLPDSIATEDDYDSNSTLPPPGADTGAGDHDLARWLDERAARKAD